MTRRRSTAEKRLTGERRPSRLRDEPEPLAAVLLPPAHLPDAAKAIWRRKEPELRGMGLLQPCDVEALALWCSLQAHIDGVVASGSVPSRDVMTSYRALLNQLGMTPEARSRLAWAPPQKPTGGKFDDI